MFYGIIEFKIECSRAATTAGNVSHRSKPVTTSNHTTDCKPCTKCGIEYPRTREYFKPDKNRPDGLTTRCQQCIRKARAQYRESHADEIRERKRREYAKNRQNPEWVEERRKYSARYSIEHADRKRESQKHYRAKNAAKIHQWREGYVAKTREQRRAYQARYRANNPEKDRAKYARYRANNPDKMREKDMRRYTKRRSLPCTFTVADTKCMMEYWNYCCAYCGAQQDFWHVIEREHWIAVTDPRPDNPGTVPTNMLPACKACNANKSNSDPVEWLNKRFGKRKAATILKRIEQYFAEVAI